MSRKIQRGMNQILFKYAPGATFSHPYHNLIEKTETVKGKPLNLSNEDDIIQRAYRQLQSNDGGVRGALKPDPNNYVIVEPGTEDEHLAGVYTEIFPRVFECERCGKLHDYTESEDLWELVRDNGTCNGDGCNGGLRQIHHVFLCPNCSYMKSMNYPTCNPHGDEHMVLNDDPDRYRNFKWICEECDSDPVVEEGMYGRFAECPECETQMIPSVHSASASHRIEGFKMVNLSDESLYTVGKADEKFDSLVLGSYLGLQEGDVNSLEDLTEAEASSIDPTGIPEDEVEVLKKHVGQLGENKQRELLLHEVKKRFEAPHVSDSLRNYVIAKEALDFRSVSDIQPVGQANQLSTEMGIDEIAVTDEFPLLATSFGYKRTFNDEDEETDESDEDEDDEPDPAVRLYNPITVGEVDEPRRPIYAHQSETEAVIVEFDPRKIGHWLHQLGEEPSSDVRDFPDTAQMSRQDAKTELYRVINKVQHHDDIEVRDPREEDEEADPDEIDAYTPETVAVHRLLHTISHLLMQNASKYSGIEETSFGEMIFTEPLAVAIYAQNTEDYIAGGLFTLMEHRLADWLRSAYREGQQCFYDNTCANIWDGACHACIHIGEVSCQHYNANLSRLDLYGDRIGDTVRSGFWTIDWDNTGL